MVIVNQGQLIGKLGEGSIEEVVLHFLLWCLELTEGDH